MFLLKHHDKKRQNGTGKSNHSQDAGEDFELDMEETFDDSIDAMGELPRADSVSDDYKSKVQNTERGTKCFWQIGKDQRFTISPIDFYEFFVKTKYLQTCAEKVLEVLDIINGKDFHLHLFRLDHLEAKKCEHPC